MISTDWLIYKFTDSFYQIFLPIAYSINDLLNLILQFLFFLKIVASQMCSYSPYLTLQPATVFTLGTPLSLARIFEIHSPGHI